MVRWRPLLALALVVSAGCTGAFPGGVDEETEWTVTVVRVVDGDTFEVRFPDGHTEHVRLLGVDVPEVNAPNEPAEFDGVPPNESGETWLRDWGHRAGEFARTELRGEEVTIRTDPTADRRGGYDRLLVYVVHDGRDFNRRLLERGYARLYDTEFEKREAYASAERDARAADRGLWGYDPDRATTVQERSRRNATSSAAVADSPVAT